MEGEIFFLDMTRDEVCRAYANRDSEELGYTDKDCVWANLYDDAKKMTDKALLEWAENCLEYTK
jgi:hypothetical protein